MNIIKVKQYLFVVAALCLSHWASADTYTYDSLNRLTAVAYSGGGGQTYNYDAAGNLLALVSTPPVTSNYTLAVNLSGAGSGTVTGSGINCGSTCSASLASGTSITLTATAATGNIFTGWSGACSGLGNCVVSMSAAQSVMAWFAMVPPTLSVSRSGTGSGTVTSTPAGIDCGATCSALFTSGTSVTLTAVPSAGSTFTGWSGDCSGLTTCVVTMSAGRNVSAGFATSSGGDLSLPLTLAQGWNLLGNSLTQPLPMAPTFSDPAVVTTVWKWDVSIGGWQFYAPSLTASVLQAYATSKGYGVLNVINPGEGYWVNAQAPTSLGTKTGPAFSLAAANLAPGWNLVATGNDVTPSAFNLSLSASPPAPGIVPFNLTSLWAWDNALSAWYFYAPTLEANGGLVNYITSKSYLDFTQSNKNLGNGVGFWVNKP